MYPMPYPPWVIIQHYTSTIVKIPKSFGQLQNILNTWSQEYMYIWSWRLNLTFLRTNLASKTPHSRKGDGCGMAYQHKEVQLSIHCQFITNCQLIDLELFFLEFQLSLIMCVFNWHIVLNKKNNHHFESTITCKLQHHDIKFICWIQDEWLIIRI
jgi:hypothetical protein